MFPCAPAPRRGARPTGEQPHLGQQDLSQPGQASLGVGARDASPPTPTSFGAASSARSMEIKRPADILMCFAVWSARIPYSCHRWGIGRSPVAGRRRRQGSRSRAAAADGEAGCRFQVGGSPMARTAGSPAGAPPGGQRCRPRPTPPARCRPSRHRRRVVGEEIIYLPRYITVDMHCSDPAVAAFSRMT